MGYEFKYVNHHVEVYDVQGNFLFSADTFQEASQDLRDLNMWDS